MKPALKQVSLLFLTALLLFRTLLVPAIFIDFQLRKAYISRHLCENRSRPELHCDGKCYLAKKLKTARDAEEREAGKQFLTQLLELPDARLTESFRFEAPLRAVFFPAETVHRPDFYHLLLAGSCFRPPQA